jgi:zinc transport system permease protein
MSYLITFIDTRVEVLAKLFNTHPFIVQGTIAIVLVSLICGAVGSQVVGNRMAFFSDALAHSAFAGISLGLISWFILGGRDETGMYDWFVPLVMIGFGCLVGIGIAVVREKTSLASDTVIGVFFAAALGIGAHTLSNLRLFTNRPVEAILFGSTNSVRTPQLIWLFGLLFVTAVVLYLRYNQMVFASFNPSLARSRRISVQWNNYAFVLLLALIVNICLQIVGVILINTMLLVPAATASVLSRNLRQMFWWTVGISLSAGLLGQWISVTVHLDTMRGPVNLGASACVVSLNVIAFAIAMLIGSRIRGRVAKTS